MAPDTSLEAVTDIQDDDNQELVKKMRLKVDLRLCTIAGLLCSLNLLDSGIISSASVTSMMDDLDLHGTRFSVAIFIFTVSSVVFQLPSTLAVRFIGPRIWFSSITVCFGIITISTAFVRTWKQMIIVRVLLGMSMSGIYPGLSYLISTWYTRPEQQLRYAFMQSGQVLALASGNIFNFGLNHLGGRAGLRGWQWISHTGGWSTSPKMPARASGFSATRKLNWQLDGSRTTDTMYSPSKSPGRRLLSIFWISNSTAFAPYSFC
jgi:MFS family permease